MMQVVPRLDLSVVSSYFGTDSGAACSRTGASAAGSSKQSPVQSPSKISHRTSCRQTEGVTLRGAGGQKSVDCEVCGKSLSHLNAQRRLQHVNRCLDRVCISV